jgi:hypothetical protein
MHGQIPSKDMQSSFRQFFLEYENYNMAVQ